MTYEERVQMAKIELDEIAMENMLKCEALSKEIVKNEGMDGMYTQETKKKFRELNKELELQIKSIMEKYNVTSIPLSD